jgi:hypothetical protein
MIIFPRIATADFSDRLAPAEVSRDFPSGRQPLPGCSHLCDGADSGPAERICNLYFIYSQFFRAQGNKNDGGERRIEEGVRREAVDG